MNIALFGATGLTGPSVLKEALARGHRVTALVGKPEAITTSHKRLRVVKGDAPTTATSARASMAARSCSTASGSAGAATAPPTKILRCARRA